MSASPDARRRELAGVSAPATRPGAGADVADDAAPRPAAARAVVTPDALTGALDELDAGPLHLALRHGALEVTAVDRATAIWETVVVEAAVEGVDGEALRHTTVDGEALRSSLEGDEQIELRIAANGAIVIGDVVLAPSGAGVPDPPRPGASGVLPQRLLLPPSAGCELILRLDGPTVCVPTTVRGRFSERQVSSVSLFARGGDWFISGVRNGSPAVVVAGAVGVY